MNTPEANITPDALVEPVVIPEVRAIMRDATRHDTLYGERGRITAPFVGRAYFLGALATTLLVAAEGQTTQQQIATGLVGGAATLGGQALDNRRLLRKVDRYQDAVSELGAERGVHLEVFTDRSARRDTVEWNLRWYPDEKQLTAAERLAQLEAVRDIAKSGNIDKVTLPQPEVLDYLSEAQAEEALTQNDFIVDIQGIGARSLTDTVHGDELVVSLDMVAFDEVIECARRDQGVMNLDSAMGILAKVAPRHPALRHYVPGGVNEQLNQKLERSLRRSIERRHDDIAVTRNPSDVGPVKLKQHSLSQISVDGDTLVDRQIALPDMSPQDAQDLLRKLKLTPDAIAEKLRNHEHYSPKEIIELSELAAYFAVKGIAAIDGADEATNMRPREVAVAELAPINPERHLQGRLNRYMRGSRNVSKDQGIETKRFRRNMSRLTTANMTWIAMMLGAAVSTVGNETLENMNHEHIAYEIGDTVTGAASVTAEGMAYPINEALQAAGIDYDHDFSGKDTTPYDSTDADPPNTPQFQLTTYGGASTEGYWAVDRSALILEEYGVPGEEMGPRIAAEGGIDYWNMPYQVRELMNPAMFGTEQPLIKVTLMSDQEYSYSIHEHENGPGWYLSDLPVLDGSRIVAASIDGQTEKLMTADYMDGRQVLYMPHDMVEQRGLDETGKVSTVEYWLMPDVEEGLRADRTMRVDNPVISMGPLTGRVDLQQPWFDMIDPNYRRSEGEMLVNAQVAAMQERFEYEIAPIPEDEQVHTLSDLSRVIFEEKVANCSAANILLATANPLELNVATGFYNRNTDYQLGRGVTYLSSRESHAWSVNYDAEIVDATPSLGAEDDMAYFSEENIDAVDRQKEHADNMEDRRESVLPKLALGATGLTAAGAAYVAYRKRESLKALARKPGDKLAERYVSRVDNGTLALAQEAINHTFFAPADMAYQATPGVRGQGDILTMLNAYADPSHLEKIKHAAKDADDGSQFGLQVGQKILRGLHSQAKKSHRSL